MSRSSTRLRRPGPSLAAGLGCLLLVAIGCNKTHHFYKHPTLVTQKDAVGYLQIALLGLLPDERREAVNHIALTRHLTHQVVLDGLDTIARIDTSDQVRCSALIALKQSGDPVAAETYFAILAPQASQHQARTASAPLRRNALIGAVALLRAGELPSNWHPILRNAAIDLLANDSDRDICIHAARALGFLPDHQVLEPLIAALDQRDFGVVYQAERSLMRLTGFTFDHDAIAWREWSATNQEPFAEAGRLDYQLDPKEKHWWYRSVDSMKRRLATFRPKSKGS